VQTLETQHSLLLCSAIDCDSMWNVWHGSKLEKRLFGNKGEKQPLLSGHQGKRMFALAQWLLTWLLIACVSPSKVYEVQL